MLNQLKVVDVVQLRRVSTLTSAKIRKDDVLHLLRAIPERASIHDLLKQYTSEALKTTAEDGVARQASLERIGRKLSRNRDAVHEVEERTYRLYQVSMKRTVTSLHYLADLSPIQHVNPRTRKSPAVNHLMSQRAAALCRTILEFGLNIVPQHAFLGADYALIRRIELSLKKNVCELFVRYFHGCDAWFIDEFLERFQLHRSRHRTQICAGIETAFREYVVRSRDAGLRLVMLDAHDEEEEAVICFLNSLPAAEQASVLIHEARNNNPEIALDYSLLFYLADIIVDSVNDDKIGLRHKLSIELSASPMLESMGFQQLMLCAPLVDDLVAFVGHYHTLKLPEFADLLQAAIDGHHIHWPDRTYKWE